MNSHVKSLEEQIDSLDAQTACVLLRAIATRHIEQDESQLEFTDDIRDALIKETGAVNTKRGVSDGDVARHALLLLCQDPRYREEIQALLDSQSVPANGPKSVPQFELNTISAVGLLTAVVFVLKTSFALTVRNGGKWRLRVESKSVDMKFLKNFIEMLAGWMPFDREDR